MLVNRDVYRRIKNELDAAGVTLVAVSKTKSADAIRSLYESGQKDFGENYVQELVDKEKELPKDIRWHFIGHLQSNKVKYIAPFVQLIHAVDSLKLLREINKEAAKCSRVINCLLQVHIATEETKFGFTKEELPELMIRIQEQMFTHVNIAGLMGMASFTDDTSQIRQEFHFLKELYDQYPSFTILSMGMSSDYPVAIAEGSTMARIGSLLFGER